MLSQIKLTLPLRNLFDKMILTVDNTKEDKGGDEVKEEEVLDSWKAISRYLDRNVRTCARWEQKLGMPVHRIDVNSSRSKVFAYKSEIDEWLKERASNKEIQKKPLLENRWAVAGLMSLFILVIAVGLMFLLNWLSRSSSSNNLSIAVLPFENHDASEYDQYFSEGITNEIISNISRQSAFRVIPARSVNSFLEREDKGGAAEELGIDFILKGRLEKSGDNIRLYVQLIRAKDERNIWDGKFDGRLEDIFSIQQNVCRKVNEVLNHSKEHKQSQVAEAGKIYDYEAYDTYLKGNFILNKLDENSDDPWKLYYQGKYYWGRCTQESNELAISLFNQAIKIDSSFAPAYIGLAHCYSNYYNLFWDSNKIWLDQAEELLKKAQTISPDLPYYYSTLTEIYLLKAGWFNEGTVLKALELAQEGIEKYPHDAQLNSITGYCYFQKFGEEGNEEDFKKALDYKEISFLLSPFAISNIVYAEFLMLDEEFYEALRVCNIIEKNDPSLMAKSMKGEIYYYMGELEQSRMVFQEFEDVPLGDRIDALCYLGMIAARKGDKEEALRIVEETERMISPELLDDLYLSLSSIYMGIDMKDQGYKYLRLFLQQPIMKNFHFVYLKYIDLDKNFDRVKEEEEFKKIIKGEETWLRAKQLE
jgi:TolB-like protein